MYSLAQKNGHVVWKKWRYAFTLGVSLQNDIYMTQEDQVFVANVVVTDLIGETMALNVIS
jgi:hypothetical protein